MNMIADFSASENASRNPFMSDGRPNRSTRQKMFRFGLIGIANSGIDFALFSAALAFDTPPLLANCLSWAGAVLFSFAANSRLSFVINQDRPLMSRLLRFAGSGALISLGVSSVILAAAAPAIGLYWAKMTGIFIAAILNFFAARWSVE
jgi:putative flippase GtrA